MTATIPIRWVQPHRTTGGPSLPKRSSAVSSGRATPTRRPARLPNPRREVVTGAKLHDILRW